MFVAYKGVAHPWLADVMGHMTTRHYVAMFDDASYHFLNEVFGWSSDTAASTGMGWADVKHVIEYQAEVATGDIVEVRAGLRKIGGKSITVFYEMFNIGRGEIAATLESSSVYFDTNARKAVALTQEMRESAGRHLIAE
ncbi:MAG: acyl-CoA thioester hydrolase [Halioglobus sp.]|jgi:acyl-CoA thioester hydrolase